MDTNTEIEVVRPKAETSPKNTKEENQYKILNYFKEHTGLLVTCVSASVAIMSFLLNFAVGRLNYAYLEYWNIASIHAIINNQNELYLVICSLLYMIILTLIHGLLSGTSEAFRHYNKLLSIMNQAIKSLKKSNKQIQKAWKAVSKRFECLKPEQKQTTVAKELEKEIESNIVMLRERMTIQRKIKRGMRELRKRAFFQIACAIIFSFFIGVLFLVLEETTITIEDSIRSSLVMIGIIIFDLVIYFLPAYFSTRCTKKQYENEHPLEKIDELVSVKFRAFPLEKLVKNGIKTMLSDKMLKFAAGQTIVVTVLLLFTISLSGTASAKQRRSFPIYMDGTTSYAIVYIADSTVIMEEAILEDRTIIIDTTKQRILTTDDISYDIIVFDNVSVIKINSENDVADVMESSFNALDPQKGGD